MEEANSYQPISLLTGIDKIFEKLFVQRLHKIIEEQNIIPD